MFGILIVDDEPRHRRGLTNMISELKPGYKIFEAKNGEQALEIIEASNIEIVFTDIRMPIMDGLQFIERLGDRIKHIKIIIISGYNYFEYAQKALKLGAFDYMLKPVEAAKVSDILQRAEQSLERDYNERNDRANVVKLLTKSLPIYLENRMNKWIKGKLNKNELSEVKDLFNASSKKVMVVTEIKRIEFETVYKENDEIDEIKANIRDWMEETMDSIGRVVSFYLDECYNRMVTIIDLKQDITYKDQFLHELLKEFMKRLESEYHLHSIIGVGNLFDAIDGSERLSFETALRLLDGRFHSGWGKVLFPSDIMEDGLLSTEERRNKKNENIITTCMKYIQEHYMDELSLDNISERFYFNPSYFSSIFKSYTGINVSDYLLNIRMERSKELLKDPGNKVYEVAVKVGYKDAKYFNRIFKKEIGMTPEEYRRSLCKKEIPIYD